MSALSHARRTSAAVSSVAASDDSHPSRCESPLLPMGQIDADRLSQQLDSPRQRQSQHSIMYKNYALRDDEEDPGESTSGEEAEGSGRRRRGFRRYPTGLGSWGRRPEDAQGRLQMRRPRSLLRPRSYRIEGGGQTSPVREFSSKIKSACKKLNPKRLARSAHHHPDAHAQEQQQQRQHEMVMQDDASNGSARFDPTTLSR